MRANVSVTESAFMNTRRHPSSARLSDIFWRALLFCVFCLPTSNAWAADGWRSGEWIRVGSEVKPIEEGYDFLARWRRPAAPLWLVTSFRQDDPGRLHWHRASSTFGGEIREFDADGGPVGILFSFLLETGSASRYVNVNTGQTYVGYSKVEDPPQARLTVDFGSEFLSVASTGYLNDFFGLKIGFWNLRQIDEGTFRHEQSEATRELLGETQSLYLQSGTWGLDVLLLARMPLELRGLGRFTLQLDAPIAYLLTGWMSLSNPAAIGVVYRFGVPRLGLSWDRRLGPLSLGVNASVPTTWLVLPTQWAGAELTLSAGLFF